MAATIKVLSRVQPKLRWFPKQGEHTSDFLARKRKELPVGRQDPLAQVLLEAQTILGRCVPPAQKAGTNTGLVVGYVQSGKTLSFTTLLALARDNGYKLVVVIAGIATNLKSQSEKRLIKDLAIEDLSQWAHYENPSPTKGGVVKAIQNALTRLNDPLVPTHKKRAVLITVLKNHSRLKNLVSVLQSLRLASVPALVIDDEADQASLNTMARKNRALRQNKKSATYDWITQVKGALPHHTFVQYTATPQAPLLIQIADVLSPSFAELLTPGSGYVGGAEFFNGTNRLIELIPSSDIPTSDNELTSPPETLQRALRYFLLGAAVHYLKDKGGKRSMMVHPSQLTDPHGDYKSWVEETIDTWKTWLDQPKTSRAYKACARLFAPEYRSLSKTQGGLPSLDKLVQAVKYVLQDIQIVQVNSTEQGERDVKWGLHDYWILIGGQKLDRGFTVEGLTVTYMPRSKGTGNADTLQQRARFFGYKAGYKGLCRVFLPIDVKEVFEKYVEHETSIRKKLAAFRGRPLSEWKRDFLLSRAMAPTRSSVIGIDFERVQLDEDWATPNALHRGGAEVVAANRRLFERTLKGWAKRFGKLDASVLYTDKRREAPKNFLIRGVPLREVLENFLLRLRIEDGGDSELRTGLEMAIQQYLEMRPQSLCDVFLIGDMEPQRRSLEGPRINQVFQGRTPSSKERSNVVYVGDRALHAKNSLTLHLRTFTFKNPPAGLSTASVVPWFAIHLTADQARDSVVERRNASRGPRR